MSVLVYTYKQCLEQKGSAYRIRQAVSNGELFQIEKGVYADSPKASALEIITAKYPDAIITMNTAFYYHGLTDVIPGEYYIATPKSSRQLRDSRIVQMYVDDRILSIGVILMERRAVKFQIYDRERMLIELLRYKNKLPYDYYKEILINYRNIISRLDIERIQEYAANFPKSNRIMEMLDTEVL